MIDAEGTPVRPRPRWNFEITLASVILISFVVLASMQVIFRYAFNAPFTWTEELSAALLIWMTFLGSTGVQRDIGHVKVEFFEELLGPKVTSVLGVLWDVMTIAFLVLLVIGGIQAYGELSYEVTPALRLPISWIVTIVPVTAGLMALYSVMSIVRRVSKLFARGRRGS